MIPPNTQIRFEDVSDEYKAFVDKFKTKKTTDDCYTPENIYNAVRDWVCREYGIDPADIVRPFWPGGDYERFPYTEKSVVVDNPPFSIVSKICSNIENECYRLCFKKRKHKKKRRGYPNENLN